MKFSTTFAACALCAVSAFGAGVPEESDYTGYLFTYFTGNDNTREDEAVRFAISDDGYNYKALNGNRPVIKSADISQTGGVRDPHIYRGPDNCFYMTVTDMVSARGWDSNRAMILLKSCDLINWTSSVINIQERYAGQEDLKRVWAPQSIYDPEAKKMLVYWSMKHGNGPDIIYYAYANDDFTDILGEPKPFFNPADGKSCIDGDIVYKDGTYYLFYKTEGHGNGIKVASTKSLTSGKWEEQPDYKQQTKEAVEGAGTFKLIGEDKYILMYDVYIKGGYQFTETTDLKNFKVVDKPVSMDFHPRHGTVIAITADEMKRLKDKWGDPGKGIKEVSAASPDGRLILDVDNTTGSPMWSLAYNGNAMMEDSPLGIVTDFADFSKNLTLLSVEEAKKKISYKQDRIKKSDISKDATALLLTFATPEGRTIQVEYVLSDNDAAFRYVLPKQKGRGSVRVMDEKTGFAIPEYATAFLAPQSDAMIGWKRTKPSYEEEYILDAPLSQKSQYGHGFTFPALFRVGNNGWVLISETGVDRRYCASRLSDRNNGYYKLEFPMPEENNGNGTAEPAFAIPGATPWRTVTVGEDLAPIVETTAMWDVVEPLYEPSKEYDPARGTWSWIMWQDDSINEKDIKEYIALAKAMGYEYTLIDCAWDKNIGWDGMEKLIAYSRSQGVEPILWYSSSGYWNDIEQSPIDHMEVPRIRRQEMAWLAKNGVKAIKVDFFGGDKQETMRLYEDILADANDFGIMVIFHGCTLPRGWERMYPNYIGSEAVLASENLVFQQHFCDNEALNATLHPFIRNAVGSMEFGGTVLNRRLNRTNDGGTTRRTSDGFEIATAVLFQSPQQNFALAPNNLEDADPLALEFMRGVPTLWDDVKYIDGYPGKYAVIARRAGDKWYLAGINAEKEPRKLKLDLSALASVAKDGKATMSLYRDGKDGKMVKESVQLKKGKKFEITLPTDGGFTGIIR